MADPVDIHHSCSGSETGSTGRKGRRATNMKKLTSARASNQKIRIDFDDNLDHVGSMAEEFHSLVALEARRKTSILIGSWKEVPENVKDQI